MFYENLKALCKAKGTTLSKVMQEIGLSSGNLSKWKSGGMPRSDTLSKIADCLDVSVNDLLILSLENDPAMSFYQRYLCLTEEQRKLVDDMFLAFESSRKET